jgi:NADPH2:quinone reductase
MLAAAGARVIGTCSTDEKAALARAAGCDAVIRYDRGDVAAEVQTLTAGEGVHVVYDSVGQSTFDASLGSLRPRGLLALFGQSSGPVPPVDLRRLTPGSFFVTRPSLAHYIMTRPELEARSRAVFDAVAGGRLQVRIGARFPLAQAADAHRALEGRATTGKVLLVP